MEIRYSEILGALSAFIVSFFRRVPNEACGFHSTYSFL